MRLEIHPPPRRALPPPRRVRGGRHSRPARRGVRCTHAPLLVLVLFSRGKPGRPEVIPQRGIPPFRFVFAGVTRRKVLVSGSPHQPVARPWCPKRKGSSGPWQTVGVAGLSGCRSRGALHLCHCGYLLAQRRHPLQRNPHGSSSMITGDRRRDFRPLSIRAVIARAGDPVRAQPL